jgi:hypothetical protein
MAWRNSTYRAHYGRTSTELASKELVQGFAVTAFRPCRPATATLHCENEPVPVDPATRWIDHAADDSLAFA